MSTPATAPRHPWELLLEQLSGRTGVLHLWGTEDDAKSADEARVAWVAAGEPTFEPCPFQLPGKKVVSLLAVPHDVTLHGGSPLDVLQRVRDLAGWIDLLLIRRQGTAGNPDSDPPVLPSPGYEIRAKGAPLKGGDAAATRWSLGLVVTLKDFALSEERPSLPVTSHQITATAQAGLGIGPDSMITPAP